MPQKKTIKDTEALIVELEFQCGVCCKDCESMELLDEHMKDNHTVDNVNVKTNDSVKFNYKERESAQIENGKTINNIGEVQDIDAISSVNADLNDKIADKQTNTKINDSMMDDEAIDKVLRECFEDNSEKKNESNNVSELDESGKDISDKVDKVNECLEELKHDGYDEGNNWSDEPIEEKSGLEKIDEVRRNELMIILDFVLRYTRRASQF